MCDLKNFIGHIVPKNPNIVLTESLFERFSLVKEDVKAFTPRLLIWNF